ncbi:MAG TPA: glycosyl hydrolase [Acidimicrobiales bacterium]|nr:glycosyl hydrolase [Acidimicrobiales bacterium]
MLAIALVTMLVAGCYPEVGPTSVPVLAPVAPPSGTTTNPSSPSTGPLGPNVPGIYWGAQIGDQYTGGHPPWDMNAVTQFEAMTGKSASIVAFAAPFANCYSGCTNYTFDTNAFENIHQHGSIPFFSWASQSLPSSLNEPNYQLRDVTAGTYDAFIRDWATAARNWGHPFFLRFNWEMNGNWFPWAEGVNGNKAGDYVAAWRHVHDIFTSVGASNAAWVWCPNVDSRNQFTSLAGLYPGDSYVDWTCLDGYNWGAQNGSWDSFDSLYHSTYHEIVDTIAPSKPMIIGEISSSETGGSKADWITDALTVQIPQRYTKIRGVVWMDVFVDNMDWPINSSASSKAAFGAAVRQSTYAANRFASAAAPLRPPT